MDERDRQAIIKNLVQLIENTELNNVLSKLVENGVFSPRMAERYQLNKEPSVLKRDMYLDVTRRGPTAFSKLVKVLVETGHQDLARLLKPDVVDWLHVPAQNNNSSAEHSYTYESVMEIVQFLLNRTTIRPKIGIICGSGLGELVDSVTECQVFPYGDIPGFPVSTVVGHAGKLVFGVLNGVQVMCMQGRFHPFEGYPVWKCAVPVRVMKLCSVTHLIVTYAAGGISKHLQVGDIMIIKGHINLLGFFGNSPLIGPNDERFGPRFPATVKCYDKELRKKVKSVAKEMGISDIIKEGVYSAQGGPAFETVAESRCLKTMGVDAIGMSTVHEVVTARHCGLAVLGLSLITNQCALAYDDDDDADAGAEAEVTHESVVAASATRGRTLQQLVLRLAPLISQ